MDENPEEPDGAKPTKPEQIKVHIRWMIARDMPEVMAIEHAIFDHPWCLEEFFRLIRQRNCIPMVAEYEEKIVGYMLYQVYPHKIFLLNLACHPEFRHRGVGRQFVAKLLRKLKESQGKRTHLRMRIRETNANARDFFQILGFRGTGLFREYYEDTREDAYELACHLNESLIKPEELPTTIFKLEDEDDEKYYAEQDNEAAFEEMENEEPVTTQLTGSGWGGRLAFCNQITDGIKDWWESWDKIQGWQN